MNDLQTKESTELAELGGFFDGNTGFEGVDSECTYLPFLKLAQDSTDERKRQHAKYIPGLEAGMYFCPATRKVYGESFIAVILRFYRVYAVYDGVGPTSKFKGLMDVAEFNRNIAPNAKREKSYMLDSKGYRYVDTRNFLLLAYDHMEDGPMLYAMSSTGITASRKLITNAINMKAVKDGKTVDAPIWSSVWKITPTFTEDTQGSYFKPSNVERLGWVGKEFAPSIKKLFEQAQATDVSAISQEEQTAHDVTGSANDATVNNAKAAVNKVFGGEDNIF